MKKLTIITGVLEAATGLALLVAPWLVGRWLLGTELVGVSVVVARVAGIALLALGIACWLGTPLCGMLSYSTLATAYLAWLAIGGVWAGPLLWPVVGLHAVFTILLGRIWISNLRPKRTGEK